MNYLFLCRVLGISANSSANSRELTEISVNSLELSEIPDSCYYARRRGEDGIGMEVSALLQTRFGSLDATNDA